MYSLIISANLNPIKYFYGESGQIFVLHFQKNTSRWRPRPLFGACNADSAQQGAPTSDGSCLNVWGNNSQRFPNLRQDFSALSCIFGNFGIIMLKCAFVVCVMFTCCSLTSSPFDPLIKGHSYLFTSFFFKITKPKEKTSNFLPEPVA